MDESEYTKRQELHRELVVLGKEFGELLKRMVAWKAKYNSYYIDSNGKFDINETTNLEKEKENG